LPQGAGDLVLAGAAAEPAQQLQIYLFGGRKLACAFAIVGCGAAPGAELAAGAQDSSGAVPTVAGKDTARELVAQLEQCRLQLNGVEVVEPA
jgi:hypothetical protein